MKRYLAVAAILLAVAPVRADNTTAGGGAELGDFSRALLGHSAARLCRGLSSGKTVNRQSASALKG